jgi:hypothetical protein
MPVEPGPFPAPPLWERRFVAAIIDVTFVGACCGGLFHSFGPLADAPEAGIWQPSAIVLGLMFSAEALSGVTPGKWMTSLAPRRPDGTSASLGRLLSRAATRYAAVFVFVLGLWVNSLFLLLSAVTLAIAYVPLCYLPLVRIGGTIFDMAAGTILVRRPSLR